MAAQGLVIGAALVAGYFATRGKQPAAAAPTPSTKAVESNDQNVGEREIQSPADLNSAVQETGNFTAPTGTQAKADTGAVVNDAISDGSTSTTPSGGTTGGSTSTTPSSGGVDSPVLGTTLTLAGSSSPSGPIEPAPLKVIDPVLVQYGTSTQLTTKQESDALKSWGGTFGLVW